MLWQNNLLKKIEYGKCLVLLLHIIPNKNMNPLSLLPKFLWKLLDAYVSLEVISTLNIIHPDYAMIFNYDYYKVVLDAKSSNSCITLTIDDIVPRALWSATYQCINISTLNDAISTCNNMTLFGLNASIYLADGLYVLADVNMPDCNCTIIGINDDVVIQANRITLDKLVLCNVTIRTKHVTEIDVNTIYLSYCILHNDIHIYGQDISLLACWNLTDRLILYAGPNIIGIGEKTSQIKMIGNILAKCYFSIYGTDCKIDIFDNYISSYLHNIKIYGVNQNVLIKGNCSNDHGFDIEATRSNYIFINNDIRQVSNLIKSDKQNEQSSVLMYSNKMVMSDKNHMLGRSRERIFYAINKTGKIMYYIYKVLRNCNRLRASQLNIPICHQIYCNL